MSALRGVLVGGVLDDARVPERLRPVEQLHARLVRREARVPQVDDEHEAGRVRVAPNKAYFMCVGAVGARVCTYILVYHMIHISFHLVLALNVTDRTCTVPPDQGVLSFFT